MIEKRRLIADILFKTRLIGLVQSVYSHQHIVVLNYHRIRSSISFGCSHFDDNVFDVDEDQFVRQMKWIKRHTHVLSETDLIDLIYNPSPPIRHSRYPRVVITFDDGYRDNYDIAYPILKSLEIPAFFFVCTQMIDDRRLGAWDILAFLIKKCQKPTISCNGHRYDIRFNRLDTLKSILAWMKTLSVDRLNPFIQQLSEICEIDIPVLSLQDKELMTWDHINKMASSVITIGSHTHTHSVLTGMENSMHLKELMTSKNILESKIGRPVLSVSYPFGDSLYIPDSIQQTAEICGYRLGFVSNFGINSADAIRPLALNRISGHLDTESTAAVMTVLPRLFTRKQPS
ncbi:MAG: polysaccharide deacetylase family protein [Desulfatirhabdiaceae bacterium]